MTACFRYSVKRGYPGRCRRVKATPGRNVGCSFASAHESNVAARELGEVRKHAVEIGGLHAEPPRKRRAVLVDRSRGQSPAFRFCIAGSAEDELRILAVDRA